MSTRSATWRTIAIVVVIAIAATAIVSVLLNRTGQRTASPQSSSMSNSPSPNPSGQGSATTVGRTVLLQIKDEQGAAVINVLLGGRSKDAAPAELYLPANLLLPTPKIISISQTTTNATQNTLAAADGLASLLGVRVDASIVLDRLALAGLVESIGGVSVTTAMGNFTLDGVGAADFATQVVIGQSEQARQKRAMLVLQEVLRGLPTSTEMLRQTLVSLGSLARTSVTDEALLPALEQLRQATIDHQTQLATLPVRAVGAAADGSVTINRELASPLLRRLFPTAMLLPGQGPLPRAIVIGAGGTAGQIAQVVADLSAAGIAVVSGGQQSPGLTQVQFDPALTESHDLAQRIAQLLAIGPDAVEPTNAKPFDVFVRVGIDGPTPSPSAS